jgi:hypothetical protein
METARKITPGNEDRKPTKQYKQEQENLNNQL